MSASKARSQAWRQIRHAAGDPTTRPQIEAMLEEGIAGKEAADAELHKALTLRNWPAETLDQQELRERRAGLAMGEVVRWGAYVTRLIRILAETSDSSA